ncbi:hypothetical protein ACH4F6_22565 [Streptomyces sp. NPDC017936]|uniref:hypothetical protein n=1 Tax=Streptomyces sp. NPDC017936 TaxID=3365016 RepID=UPI003792B536
MSIGELPPQAAGSDVTRQLCTAVYARPDRAGDRTPWGEDLLFRLIDEVLRDPARSVPSYGFDLVPVLAHGVRARRLRLARRAALLAVLVLVAVWAPLASLTWLVALGCAYVLGPSGTGWAVLPLAGYWIFALLAIQRHDGLVELWTRSVQLPLVLGAAVALVYVVDAVAAGAARERAVRDGGTRERLPPVGGPRRRRVERLAARQNGTELPYDDLGRFIGAGRDVRGAAQLRVPLRPEHPQRPVVALREADLLHSIAVALSAAGHGESAPGEPTETAPLPGFSVARVLALPAGLWLERNRKDGRASPQAGGLGRPDRPYLRAQCVSWEGQLVVNLFVHAALQAGELRLTMRPQVMAPLLALPGPTGPAVLTGLRRTAVPWHALWRRIRKTPAEGTRPAAPDGPLSLRDALSLAAPADLHQRGDAERHVELMQSAVLSAVESLLERHGFATEAFSDRRTVINSIHVLGDNTGVVQLAGGVRVTHVAQDAEAATRHTGAGPAPGAATGPDAVPAVPSPPPPPRPPGNTTEGVLMSPGFPRRDPAPEPARAPGAGISIGGDNNGTAQNAVGHRLSRITQSGTGQASAPLDSVARLLEAFRADVDHHAALLADPQALQDQASVLAGALTAPDGEGFRPALRTAARSLPALIAGTAVQQSGEALVTAIRELLG